MKEKNDKFFYLVKALFTNSQFKKDLNNELQSLTDQGNFNSQSNTSNVQYYKLDLLNIRSYFSGQTFSKLTLKYINILVSRIPSLRIEGIAYGESTRRESTPHYFVSAVVENLQDCRENLLSIFGTKKFPTNVKILAESLKEIFVNAIRLTLVAKNPIQELAQIVGGDEYIGRHITSFVVDAPTSDITLPLYNISASWKTRTTKL